MRKNIILFLAVCLLQATAVKAQTTALDSVQRLLKNETQDTNRVHLLNKFASLYLLNNPDTALLLGQEGFALARKIGFTKGAAVSLNRIANVFNAIGNYPKALELHLASLKMAEEAKDERAIVIASLNIGTDQALQGNDRQAILSQLKGLPICRRLNDKRSIATVLGNVGDGYEKLNILDSARLYTNQFYDMAVQMKDGRLIGIALNNLGNIYAKMGQDAIAMGNYNLAVPYYLEEDDEDGLCEAYLGMAKLFHKAGKIDSSLHYAKLSLAYAQKGGFTMRVMQASNFLTDHYTAMHNVDSAFVYQSATIAAKDSLFSEEKQREIQSLNFDEAMRQQELAMTKVQRDTQRMHNIQFAVIALVIVSFLILFLLLSRTVIVTEKWIRFLGVLGLLLFFEFVNLFIHPYISEATGDSPLYMLLIMVLIASLLIPLHHRIERWIKEKMVAKNKRIRLAAAKRTVAELEKGENQ